MFKKIKRTVKYYWIKKYSILICFAITIPFSFLAYAWMSGKLAIEGQHVDPLLQSWSNPGALSAPIAITVMMFIVALIKLLYVILQIDIDEVLPE